MAHILTRNIDLLRFKCFNRPQRRRLERLQCSLHDPVESAVSPALQELAKGRRHVLSM
jgi:hypothetical protein